MSSVCEGNFGLLPGSLGSEIFLRFLEIARFYQGNLSQAAVIVTGYGQMGGYGVAVGGAFTIESQFTRELHTSKIGFAVLNWHLARWGFVLNDNKGPTRNTIEMGFEVVSRAEYRSRLAGAMRRPDRCGKWTAEADLQTVAQWQPVVDTTQQDTREFPVARSVRVGALLAPVVGALGSDSAGARRNDRGHPVGRHQTTRCGAAAPRRTRRCRCGAASSTFPPSASAPRGGTARRARRGRGDLGRRQRRKIRMAREKVAHLVAVLRSSTEQVT